MLKSTVAELSADERACWEEITAVTATDAQVAKIDKLMNGSGFMYTANMLQALVGWYEREAGGDCPEATLLRETAAKLAIIEAQTV